jgi:hypothetical protein
MMTWEGHREIRKILVGNMKVRDQMVNLGVHGSIILERMLSRIGIINCLFFYFLTVIYLSRCVHDLSYFFQ